MAATIAGDVRRTDQRVNVLANPYWITSANIGQTKGVIQLFSFPVAELIFVHEVACYVSTAYSAGTTLKLGLGTIATDDVTTGGSLTETGAEFYIAAADITATTGGYYLITNGNISTFGTANWVTRATTMCITGAAATVPCIYTTIANAGAISAGAARFMMLISKPPIY